MAEKESQESSCDFLLRRLLEDMTEWLDSKVFDLF